MIRFLLVLLVMLTPALSHAEEQEAVGEALIACDPKEYRAAIDCLDTHLTQESKDFLKENGAAIAHFDLGLWIRNNWGLWQGDDLGQAMHEQGFLHPDDMSAAILDGLVARLRGETFDVDQAIEEYRDYWKRAGEREEVACKGDQSEAGVKCFRDGNGNYYREFEAKDK